ncbi:hypothetical protein psyc5s11_11800 [Clostridium gelidum]|uniref:Uncharacterized protein n=1 Tax=Clostridium gelidum TaxID=704125 RepID=A0ABM7T884_9CLOT|nr:hypothetical protein [Clostridium gelidum]BCZ45113.1 hypothetical protein psyc5s11_11800 [Clostridium gelidum]
MEFTTRDIIAILTVLGTLVVLHIKAFYNFFMAIVKIKYKEVPGKQSMFSVVIEWIGFIGFFIYVIVLGSMFIKNFYKINFDISLKNMNLIYFMELILFALVIVVIIFVSIDAIQKFRYLKKNFRKKLEGDLVTLEDNIESKNMKNIYVFSVSIVLFLFVILDGISRNIEIMNSKFVLFPKNEPNEIFIIALTMEIIISTLLLISINMKEIIKTLRSNDLYMILIDDEEIYCSCYLEYKNHYLIIKKDKGIERYISKSKVKEIRKIRSK